MPEDFVTAGHDGEVVQDPLGFEGAVLTGHLDKAGAMSSTTAANSREIACDVVERSPLREGLAHERDRPEGYLLVEDV